jgi:hypothetical protein
MTLKIYSIYRTLLILLLLFCCAALAPAQPEKATLILQSGEEIPCQIKRVAHGYVYFEATTTSLAFKYGDFIEVEKVAAVRLFDGQTLTMNEYLASRGISLPAEPSVTAKSRGKAKSESAVPPPPSGPGLRLTSKLTDTTRTADAVGLRLPDLPAPPPVTAEMNYAELANLLAEAGLVGKLLNEINAGVLAARVLTTNQKQFLEAVAQSPVWIARKNALREAQRVAEGEFNILIQRQPDLLAREFRFQPATGKNAYAEFVQFLQIQNVLHFQDKWEQVEKAFGADAAAALRDILNNYEDWLFLFGEAAEKR